MPGVRILDAPHGSVRAVVWHRCDLCSYKTRAKNILSMHKSYKHETKGVWYKCDKCDFTSRREITLKGHKEWIHEEGVAWHRCNLCSYKGRSPTELRYHMSYVHDVKVTWHHCGSCLYKTKLRNDLLRHRHTAHGKGLIHYPSELYPSSYETSKGFIDPYSKLKIEHNANVVQECIDSASSVSRLCQTVHATSEIHSATNESVLNMPMTVLRDRVNIRLAEMRDHTQKLIESANRNVNDGSLMKKMFHPRDKLPKLSVITAGPTVYRCDACNFTSGTMERMRNHKVNEHSKLTKRHPSHLKASSESLTKRGGCSDADSRQSRSRSGLLARRGKAGLTIMNSRIQFGPPVPPVPPAPRRSSFSTELYPTCL